MNNSTIKSGDLVTIQLSDNNPYSNVYKVVTVMDDKCLLNHPLFADCYIIKPNSVLNITVLSVKNSTEKCLEYAMRHKKFLDYETIADLESMCMYFIVTRDLSLKQKKVLSNICGKIASIYYSNDINKAIDYVKENAGVLDEFNQMWYSNFEKIFNKEKVIKTKNQRLSIFNIAGFVLAQLENTRIESI